MRTFQHKIYSMNFKKNLSKKIDILRPSFDALFKISVPFLSNRNSMLEFMKNDETVPIRSKNYLFLSFPESFYMFFTETHGRGLGLVAHALK